jgi:hypothetical protein
MASVRLWIGAVGAESAGLAWLLLAPTAPAALAGYLPLHALASAAAAVAAGRLLPRPYRQPRRWVWASLFGFNFFVPVIGLAATLIGVAGGHLLPLLLAPRVFGEVPRPQFTAAGDEGVARRRGAAARAQLMNPQAPQASRVEALLAVGAAGTPATGGLLRELLADANDEVRLLAYGLLDRREKEISAALARNRRLLALAEEIDDRADAREICGRIAQLYWELVYQDLASGDTARYALEQTLVFAERALGDDAGDGARWLLIARAQLRRRDLAAAEHALRQAAACRLPRRSVLPYLAELRFAQRRYDEVRRTLLELGGRPGSETLAAMQQYWVA